MEEHPNATLFGKAFQAMIDDPASAADYIADDVVWWQIGSEEPLRGKQALIDSLAGLDDVDWQVEIHDVTASDHHVVGLANATVRMGDQTFSYRTAEIGHIEDGKITERWAFSDDTQRITDFFSRFQAE